MDRPVSSLASKLRGLDYRSLGLFRIALGLVLIANWWLRIGGGRLEALYTENGVMPVALLSGDPYRWSFLDAFSSLYLARLAFLFILIVYLCFTLGIYTRLSHWLSALCLISIFHRNPLVNDGSDWTLLFFLLWTLFFPLGERFSFDELVRRKRRTPAEFRSLAVWFFLANLGLSYFLNAYQKTGATWLDYTALRYLFWEPWFISPLAALLRPHVPLVGFQLMAVFAKGIEYALVVLPLLALFSQRASRIAGLFILALHGGFALFLHLGIFPFTYLAVALLFIPTRDWDRFLPGPGAEPSFPPPPRSPWIFSEGLAALYFLLAINNLLVMNPGIPLGWQNFAKRIRPAAADWITSLTGVTQEWSMFINLTPNTTVGSLELRFPDGRRIDPLRQIPFDPFLPVRESATIPKYWRTLLMQIANRNLQAERQSFFKYWFSRGAEEVNVHVVATHAASAVGDPTILGDRIIVSGKKPSAFKFFPRDVTSSSVDLSQVSIQPMGDFGSAWTGVGQLLVPFGAPKESIDLAFAFPRSCEADVTLFLTRAADYGSFSFAMNGKNFLREIDLYSPREVEIGELRGFSVEIQNGENHLAVGLLGKNKASRGQLFGMDRLEIACNGGAPVREISREKPIRGTDR